MDKELTLKEMKKLRYEAESKILAIIEDLEDKTDMKAYLKTISYCADDGKDRTRDVKLQLTDN
jgi:hypothetical protein